MSRYAMLNVMKTTKLVIFDTVVMIRGYWFMIYDNLFPDCAYW